MNAREAKKRVCRVLAESMKEPAAALYANKSIDDHRLENAWYELQAELRRRGGIGW